jgi:hypothetical protein
MQPKLIMMMWKHRLMKPHCSVVDAISDLAQAHATLVLKRCKRMKELENVA